MVWRRLCSSPTLKNALRQRHPNWSRLLKEDRLLSKWFEQLSYSVQKYIADMITAPRSADARVRRAEQAAEWMMLAMEGERELPPILQVAFRRQPRRPAPDGRR